MTPSKVLTALRLVHTTSTQRIVEAERQLNGGTTMDAAYRLYSKMGV